MQSFSLALVKISSEKIYFLRVHYIRLLFIYTSLYPERV